MFLYSKKNRNGILCLSDRKLSYSKFLNYRKEKLSPPIKFFQKDIRAFFFASRQKNRQWSASLTVEAALVFPVFLFLMVAVLQYTAALEAAVCYGAALAEAGKQAAVQSSVVSESGTAGAVRLAGAGTARSRLLAVSREHSAVKLQQLQSSQSDAETDVLELRMTGLVQGMAGRYLPRIPILQKVRVRVWTGRKGIYGADGDVRTEQGGKMVYVTATGTVYHRDPSCTHLKLSIREVDRQSVSKLRNKSGEKYHACERCSAGSSDRVYITGEGNRYHSSLACSGLKRTVEEIPQEECHLRACSKCGGHDT